MYQQFVDESVTKLNNGRRPINRGQIPSRNTQRKIGKSASLIRQKIDESGVNQTRKRDGFKEDQLIYSTQQPVGDPNTSRPPKMRSLHDPELFDFSKSKRRELSEPARFVSKATQKLFKQADLLVLENRSTSKARSFKIFNEQEVFPETRMRPELLEPIDAEDKHDECDYETEAEHVYKA